MPYYRVTQAGTIEGTEREEGFILLMSERKAAHYSDSLELTDPPPEAEEAEPVTQQPQIKTLDNQPNPTPSRSRKPKGEALQ